MACRGDEVSGPVEVRLGQPERGLLGFERRHVGPQQGDLIVDLLDGMLQVEAEAPGFSDDAACRGRRGHEIGLGGGNGRAPRYRPAPGRASDRVRRGRRPRGRGCCHRQGPERPARKPAAPRRSRNRSRRHRPWKRCSTPGTATLCRTKDRSTAAACRQPSAEIVAKASDVIAARGRCGGRRRFGFFRRRRSFGSLMRHDEFRTFRGSYHVPHPGCPGNCTPARETPARNRGWKGSHCDEST